MFIREAIDLGCYVSVMDPKDNAPCSLIAQNFRVGDITDYQTVLDFGRQNDVITIEIEAVNAAALKQLQEEGKTIRPSPQLIATIQDKGLQKQFLHDNGFPTASFRLIRSKEEIANDPSSLPKVQKLRSGGYDGKGVQVLEDESDLQKAFDDPSVIEDKLPLKEELAIQVSRDGKGRISFFPPVGMKFYEGANLLDYLYAPVSLSNRLRKKLEEIAVGIAEKSELEGILAIEFFLDHNDELWVNEMAPRPHNSGHHTMQANYTSQYGQLLRTLLDLPPGETGLHHAAVMVNLLGEEEHKGVARIEGINKAMELPRVFLNFYGKKETRPFRKMGHATVLGNTTEEALEKARLVKEHLKIKS